MAKVMKQINILVTIGLPTLGREEELLNTIKMLLVQNYTNFELLIADQTNTHTDDFYDVLGKIIKNDSRVKYFRTKPENLPAARNFILDRAKGEIILYLDDDIEIEPDFLKKHINAHALNPGVTAVGGRIIQRKVPESDKPCYFDEYGFPHGTFNCKTNQKSTSFPGGNTSIVTDHLRNIGGFNTLYEKNALREESDTAHRLNLAGYQIYFCSEAYLIHLAAPYGGCRIYTHQYDNPWFYINDLLFTFRVVKRSKIITSLGKKYKVYTDGPTLKNRLKRKTYFAIGLIRSFMKYCFGRQIKPKELAR